MTCSNTSFCISGVERCSEGMCSVGFLGGDDTTAPTSSGGESSSWGWVWLSRMLVGVVSAMCAGITYWDSCLIPDASSSVVFGLVDSWILTSSSSKTFSKSAPLSFLQFTWVWVWVKVESLSVVYSSDKSWMWWTMSRSGMSKLFQKGPCGCRFLFQPVKSTRFDQWAFWRLRPVD